MIMTGRSTCKVKDGVDVYPNLITTPRQRGNLASLAELCRHKHILDRLRYEAIYRRC